VIFEIASIYKESLTALRGLLDEILKHFRAFERPVDYWDDTHSNDTHSFYIYILSKLDYFIAKE